MTWELNEAEFAAEVASLAGDVLADWRAQLIMLADDVYGLGIPESLRRRKTSDGRQAKRCGRT